jgi:hypothetical protein
MRAARVGIPRDHHRLQVVQDQEPRDLAGEARAVIVVHRPAMPVGDDAVVYR